MRDTARHAVLYHLYPLGFLAAEPDAADAGPDIQHRLRGIESWLDYVIELGCNVLLLGPVFASQTHGYDTVDHHLVDPRLGDEADLEQLVEACHARGIKVVLDGVFNHVGHGHPAFQDVLERRAQSPYRSWFRVRFDGDRVDYDTFEGHGQLVALNHDEPAVVDLVTAVLQHWLDHGVDGWRMDAAYAVPTSFWRTVTARVRESHPHAYLFGEVLHGDYCGFVRDSGLDAVTQYELWKALWSSMNDGNLFELAWALQRHAEMAEQFRPVTFAGNHDVTRLASALNDSRHVAHVLTALFTLPGSPTVYAGDEQGWRGVKEHRVGGDDAVRSPFPAEPSQLGADGWPVYRLHQELIALRRRHSWLADGRLEVGHVANTALSYVVHGPEESVAVVLNIGDTATTVAVPLPAGHWAALDVEAGNGTTTRAGDTWQIAEVPPQSWAVAVARHS